MGVMGGYKARGDDEAFDWRVDGYFGGGFKLEF